MNNGQINKKFLNLTDANTRKDILDNIANHYGISVADVEKEVFDSEAEHLLDYITGPIRTAAHVVMQRHGLDRPA